VYGIQNISLLFGDRVLFDNISFVISPGDKVALVGKNGAGKTTLFKVITKELSPESGNISIPNETRIGYLSQHLDFEDNKTIREVCLECFDEYFKTKERLDQINTKLETETDAEKLTQLIEELDECQTYFNNQTIHNPLAETAKILKGFGFKEEQLDQPISTLSGGWKMRVQMSKLLLSRPDLLLLDEPDNHLDIEALIWFEKYLQQFTGAILFISHDVDFMSNVATRILELSNRKIGDYKVKYKKYLAESALRKEKEQQAYVNQQKVIKEKERTITRFMAKATKTKMAQSMKKQLDKMERIELTEEDLTKISIQFPVVGKPGKIVTTVKDAYKSYGDKKVLENISLTIERGQKVAFVGQNGQGKSTLVKMISGSLPYEKGTVDLGHNVMVSYFAQDQAEELNEKLTALETIEDKAEPELRTKGRSILGAFGFSGEEAEKKVSVLSGGEKSRLAMACLVSQKSNFLILDEPTNHLDIQAKQILKQAILDYPGTLIIVSHDREILRGTVEMTYEFRDRKVIQHLGDLDYVLEKRKMDDVRDLSKTENNKTKSGGKKSQKSELSYDERKKINRNISRVEKRMAEAEEEIKSIQEKLMDASFYNSPEGTEAVKKLNPLEEKVEALSAEWDEWVSKLDD
jgi:ATP-binding cassette subfamily F protein 3